MNLTPATHAHLAAVLSLAAAAAEAIRANRDSLAAATAKVAFWKSMVAFINDKSLPAEDLKATRDFREAVREIIAKAESDAIVAKRA
jgi:hypothetical protein